MKPKVHIFSLKRSSIRTKLILLFTILVLLLATSLVAVLSLHLSQQFMSKDEQEVESSAKFIALTSVSSLQLYDYLTLQQNIDNYLKREDILYVIVYNKDNKVVASSSKIQLDKIIKKEKVISNLGTEYQKISYNLEGSETVNVLDILRPINAEGSFEKWGSVELGLSLKLSEEHLFRLRHDIYFISFIVILLSWVVGSRYLSKSIYKPIVEIIKGTKEAALGNLDYKINVRADDEFGHLAKSFNLMTDELLRSHKEIENWGKELEVKVRERTEKLEKSEEALLNILSDFKEVNQKIKESEARYRQFFEEDLTGDFISTVDGKIIACNPAYAKIFGYGSIEEALNHNTASNYSNRKNREDFLALLKEKKKLEYYEMELVNRAGKPIYIIENVYGQFDNAGNLVAIRGYLFDNTERKGLENQLLQAQKMQAIGTLAGGIAHDFNNVMGIILGVLDMIEHKSTNKDLQRYIDMGKKAVDRGASVAKQLLLFSRSEKGDFKPLSLHQVVNEVVNIIRHSFPKSIELEMKSAMKNGIISGDSGQIHQALLNLCVNARDAMPDGGTLTIQLKSMKNEEINGKFPTAQAKSYVALSVIDTGIGITKEVRERMFDPFFTTKERGSGTGLGLSIIYGIVNSHNALIDVQSEVGKGSTFSIYFPTIEAVNTLTNPTVEEDILGGDEVILVVEDEEHLLDIVTTTLKSVGYNIITAKDGFEGLNVYKENCQKIHLVLSDLGLPKLSGDQMFSEMKNVNPDIKVIIATGYIDLEKKETLFKHGIKNILHKPLQMNELLKSVREVLDLK
jgi:two-component system cell cycle sensor histidine kinase/response regulator CckA